MRVLVLCKRQYTHQDLLDHRYGRLFELPAALAARGHEVQAAVSSYRPRGAQTCRLGGVLWESLDAWPQPWACYRQAQTIAARFRPEIIWASADVLQLAAGARLARQLGRPLVLDLYDDYEAFGLTRLPGLRRVLRRACAQADALSVVSHSLVGTLRQRGEIPGRLAVIGNGVAPAFAHAAMTSTQPAARLALGLPLAVPLVGSAGALDATRGIQDLLEAYYLLAPSVPGLRLVVAGPRSSAVQRALPGNVVDLGILPYERMPLLLRSLDVGVICNRDSPFGRACFPQKLGEMVACGLPLVAAAVGEVAALLAAQPACLYPPGDPHQLAERLAGQLRAPQRASPTLGVAWEALGLRLESLLVAALAQHH